MHFLFRDYMLAQMAGAIGKFHATLAIQHNGVKGSAREALAESIIRPWFGPSVEIGSGIVIDSANQNSLQCDNVLYWPDVQPATVLGGYKGPCLFPVEGVASVVEVKSSLTTTELDSALHNLKSSCRNLEFCSGTAMDKTGFKPPHIITHPFACILAFSSNVAIETLIKKLKTEQSWDVVCVLGSNGGLYARLKTGQLAHFETDTDEKRLLEFSVMLRDNIQDIRASRGTPSLGSYVAERKMRIL